MGKKKGGIFIIIAALVIFLAYMSICWTIGTLELKNRDTGKILFFSSVCSGDEFSLWFINSRDRFPMTEVFQIQADCGINLSRIDSDYEIAGNPWAYQDIRNINDKRNNPYLFFSGGKELTQHTFIYRGSKIPLWKEPQQLMEVNISKIPIWRYISKWISWEVSAKGRS